MPSTKPPTPVALRDRLRYLVEQDGRTQTEIAESVGMSQAHLSQILNGIRDKPSADTVGRLLTAMGKRWRDLD